MNCIGYIVLTMICSVAQMYEQVLLKGVKPTGCCGNCFLLRKFKSWMQPTLKSVTQSKPVIVYEILYDIKSLYFIMMNYIE